MVGPEVKKESQYHCQDKRENIYQKGFIDAVYVGYNADEKEKEMSILKVDQ